MPSHEENIIEILRRRGPSLPVEISKELGLDSFLTSAILSGMASSRKIRMSYKRIGSSRLYFLEHQYESARKILLSHLSIQEKNVLNRIKSSGFLREEDLTPHEKFFIKELYDFVIPTKINGIPGFKYYAIPDSMIKIQKEEPALFQKEEKIEKKERPKQEVSNFEDKVINYLKNLGSEIIDKKVIRKGKEFNFIISIKTPLGNQIYHVKAKNKKKITESDLSVAYTEGMRAKKPVIFISNGTLSNKAKKFKEKNVGELLHYIKIS